MSESLTSHIDLCRPGEAAVEWLAHAIDAFKGSDPLVPVTVVPPNMPAGRMALRQLAERSGYVNVRMARLVEVAAVIARPLLAEREPLTPVLEASAARAAATEVSMLRPLAEHLALTQALMRLFRELRRTGNDLDGLPESASPMAHAAADAYRRFRRLTEGFVDPMEIRRLAVQRLANSDATRELREIGPLVLYLPTRLDSEDTELLAAISRHTPLAVAFPELFDPQGLGGQRAIEDYERLLERLGLVLLDSVPQPRSSLDLRTDVRIVRVPDPTEETREVVRAVAAAMEGGTPLWRMAVLYRQPELYAQMLRDAFELAGLPCFPLGGVSLADTRPAQVLLDLLQLHERSFGREAVLGVVSASPAFTQPGLPSPSTWDRISRDANAVRGTEQWVSRLRAYADYEDARPRTPFAASDTETSATVRASRAERARQIATTIEELAEALVPPPDGSPWDEFVGWAARAYERFGGKPDLWPVDERPRVEQVSNILSRLSGARFEEGATFAVFRAALEDALGSTACPARQLGGGVVLGSVQSIVGMAFDQIFLVGLNEGAFPPVPPASPFFPSEAEDVLGVREQYRRRDREAFLTALASARDRVTLLTPQSSEGRAAFPSRWLLEVAAALNGGQPLSASGFAALRETEHPWLRVVRSAREGVATGAALADLEDRRLSEASAWTGAGRRLPGAAIAHRHDLPLGRALSASAARRSSDFTEFDGNTSELAAHAQAIARIFSGERPLSATSVQEWASCPFSYFLDQVLGIRPSETPEDRWTIDPAERGTLVHNILEEFLSRESHADRPLGIRPYDESDRELLREIAEKHFEELRTSGRAGNPLVWQATAADVWADLETFLRQDQIWRAEGRWRPARFEQAFGMDREDSWPALELSIDGLSLRFRGQVDRIDLSEDGRRAFLYDYKTGRNDNYKAVEVDPVIAGRALQLALYSEVARQNLGEAEMKAAYWFISSRGGFAMHGLRYPAEQVSARLHEVLHHIASGIREGAFPAVPGEEHEFYGTFQNCGYCPYDRVCPNARDQLWLAKRESRACQMYEALALPETLQ
ncbi:MAG TPA: PD-(D/E)XK nuclease family protein [Chloroflexota bacterium]|nr:PD-(D/E)XK nuclease family protein [Chloroflexota bacterium]